MLWRLAMVERIVYLLPLLLGVPAGAEKTPFEPDPDYAGVGKRCAQFAPFLRRISEDPP
jgi:hypothetical protein